MYFHSLVLNWSVASRIKPHVVKQNVTQLMTSNYFRQYITVYILQIFDVIQSDVAQKQVH